MILNKALYEIEGGGIIAVQVLQDRVDQAMCLYQYNEQTLDWDEREQFLDRLIGRYATWTGRDLLSDLLDKAKG